MRDYLSAKKDVTDQRVFLARSDPAMNYGTFGAVVSNKTALMRLEKLSAELGVKRHPLLGAGSAPYRGNLSPRTVRRFTASLYSLGCPEKPQSQFSVLAGRLAELVLLAGQARQFLD